MEFDGELSEMEAAALASVAQAAIDAAAKLGPALAGIGAKLVTSVKGVLTGTLTPDQYAQLELDEQADIEESAANSKFGDPV